MFLHRLSPSFTLPRELSFTGCTREDSNLQRTVSKTVVFTNFTTSALVCQVTTYFRCFTNCASSKNRTWTICASNRCDTTSPRKRGDCSVMLRTLLLHKEEYYYYTTVTAYLIGLEPIGISFGDSSAPRARYIIRFRILNVQTVLPHLNTGGESGNRTLHLLIANENRHLGLIPLNNTYISAAFIFGTNPTHRLRM